MLFLPSQAKQGVGRYHRGWTQTRQPSARSFLLPRYTRTGCGHRFRRHPQTNTLALCLERYDRAAPGTLPLPRLPPEVWDLILQDVETTGHPLFGILAPLLIRPGDPSPDHRAAIHYSHPNFDRLPKRTRNRWQRMHRQGIHLHLMDNRTQIREYVHPGATWPMKDWPQLELLEVGQRAAEVPIRFRLRGHLLPPVTLDPLAAEIAQQLDDSETWRFMATIAPDLRGWGVATVPARSHALPSCAQPKPTDGTIRTRFSRLTRRRLDDDPTLERLASTPSIRPPLGLHIREQLSPTMLRYLARQGLCAPDNQPPPTATTAGEIIRHIFSQE